MPLIVNPDGTVSEGAIPPNGTAVLVLDQGEIKEAFVAAGSGGSSLNYPFLKRAALTQRTFLSTVQQNARVAYDVLKLTYSYSGLYGATTATSATVAGNTNWTNPANAQGINNGTVATIASSLTAAANANLTLVYAALTNKTMFTITKVELIVYSSLTVGLAQTVAMTARYSINGGTNYTQLYNRTAAFNNLSAGEVFDITTAVAGNWNNLQNVRVQIQGNMGTAASSGTASVDAVTLRITTNPIEQVQ